MSISFAKAITIAGSFFILWIFVGFNLSIHNSPTFDEPVHYLAGVRYQQGDFSFDPIEPPFLRRFVYTVSQSTPLTPRQIIISLTGLLAGLLVYFRARRAIFSGWLTALLLLSEPNLLAHSSLFTTDAVSAFLAVSAAVLILKEFWRQPWQLLILTLAVSLAAATKVSTLSLLAPLLLIKSRQLGLKRLFIISLLSCFLIWSTYNFRLELPFRQFPFPLPLGGYLRALKENLLFAQRGHPLFFRETLYVTGPWFKQLLVFLLKTPPLHLLLGLISGQFLLPLSLIFIVNSTVGLHFGIRHLLPASLFLILGAVHFTPRNLYLKLALSLLVLIQTISVYRHLPQLLTYANLTAPAPERVFTDSDFDWGQGLYALKSDLDRRNLGHFQLAYFGHVDPATYLTGFNRLRDCNPVGSLPVTEYDPQLPAIISVTCYYQAGYYRLPHFSPDRSQIIAQSFLFFP